MRAPFLVLSVLTASIVYAQPRAAAVYNSTANAPVAVTGNVTCSEKIKGRTIYTTASGELNFRNTSNLGAVDIEASASVQCMHGPPYLVRYHHGTLFFMPNGLASGESISKPVALPDGQSSRLDHNAAPTPPRVDVEIHFVQFEDGTTWGRFESDRRSTRSQEEHRVASCPFRVHVE